MKGSNQMPYVFRGFLSAMTLWAGSVLSAAPPADGPEKVFVGYVHQKADGIRYQWYTHLCHAFVVADEAGQVKPNDHVPSHELAREAHQAGVKVLLSLGGWGWDQQFAAMTSSPEAEVRYVAAVIGLVEKFNYDGVDLDWEYPDTRAEVIGFERLARTLRAGLDEIGDRKCRPMLLTMAASANPETLHWLKPEFLLETIDWINVMTYDYTGRGTPFAGHHSPLHASSRAPANSSMSTELTMQYLVDTRKLPADRLAVGLPLYGRGFGVGEPYASTANAAAPPYESANYARIHQLQHDQGWIRTWDDETKNPWLISPEGVAAIGYDDDQSVAMKAEWAMKKGFRGVFFWQIAGDRLPDGSNPLQEAAHAAWVRYSAR